MENIALSLRYFLFYVPFYYEINFRLRSITYSFVSVSSFWAIFPPPLLPRCKSTAYKAFPLRGRWVLHSKTRMRCSLKRRKRKVSIHVVLFISKFPSLLYIIYIFHLPVVETFHKNSSELCHFTVKSYKN